MPTYVFTCPPCAEKEDAETAIFEVVQTMKDYTGSAACPDCGISTDQRIYTGFAVHEGMTANQKRAGATKRRMEFTKYAKDERTKRKKNAEPGTMDAVSNELWTGKENLKGVMSPKA